MLTNTGSAAAKYCDVGQDANSSLSQGLNFMHQDNYDGSVNYDKTKTDHPINEPEHEDEDNLDDAGWSND